MDPVAFFSGERWTAGVIGLGYVGLPLSVTIVERGLGCIGFDVSARRVDDLHRARSPVEDVSDEQLQAALAGGLEVTADASRLAEADAIFICVPSPLDRVRQPDLSHIHAAAETVAKVARKGQLIVLESTTYPGTTEEVIVPAATANRLELDEDVFVAFSPERVDPGNPLKSGDIPKVVGGVSRRSGEVAAAAYGRIVPDVHLVSTAKAAELTKLLENTYRSVNIALINEMAQLADHLDIDIWEVIDAAATKPFGFQAFYPGPGVGGHCIPLDPQFLAWRARELKFATRFIDLAEQINIHMPEYVVDRLAAELNQRELPVYGTKVLAVGIAYKPNVGDDRESPALDVLELLEQRGARIGVLDRHVPDGRIEAHGFHPVADRELGGWTAAVVLTDHDGVDYEAIADAVTFTFDTRGVYRRLGFDRPDVVAL